VLSRAYLREENVCVVPRSPYLSVFHSVFSSVAPPSSTAKPYNEQLRIKRLPSEMDGASDENRQIIQPTFLVGRTSLVCHKIVDARSYFSSAAVSVRNHNYRTGCDYLGRK